MDGAGRLARSLRSLRPQADLKAAAIGAVVLLREWLDARRAAARSRRAPAKQRLDRAERTAPPDRADGAPPSAPRRRRRDRADAARQRRLRHRQGRPSRGIHLGPERHPQCDRQFGRIPDHHGRHQRPQAIDPGRGAGDRRRQRPLLAVVPRCRRGARQAESQSLDRRRDGAEALSRPAPDRHCRTLGLRAVAAGWPAVGDCR